MISIYYFKVENAIGAMIRKKQFFFFFNNKKYSEIQKQNWKTRQGYRGVAEV